MQSASFRGRVQLFGVNTWPARLQKSESWHRTPLMTNLGSTTTVAVCAILLGGASARAQGPERTTATFGDWTVVCVQPSDGPKACELVHAQKVEGQAEPAGQITISRATKAEPFKLIIQIPPNAWFATGVRFVFDDKDPGILASLRWCLSTRCRADADLTAEALKLMRVRTEPGRVEFKEATEQDVRTPVSFKGFTAALEYMEKGEEARLA